MRRIFRKRKPSPHEPDPITIAAREEADEAIRRLRETRYWLHREEDTSDVFDDLLGLKHMNNPDGEG